MGKPMEDVMFRTFPVRKVLADNTLNKRGFTRILIYYCFKNIFFCFFFILYYRRKQSLCWNVQAVKVS